MGIECCSGQLEKSSSLFLFLQHNISAEQAQITSVRNDEKEKGACKMEIPLTKDEYMSRFQKNVTQAKKETGELEQYLKQQYDRLNQLTSTVSPENFWEALPEVLGIDAKLSLITELIQYDDFSMKEILRMVETDYRTYFKEICGNELSVEGKYSIVFNVV